MEGERERDSDLKVKVIEWEDFEQELARLWSLSSALKQANQNKLSLHRKLHSLIQVKTQNLLLRDSQFQFQILFLLLLFIQKFNS